MSPQGATTPRIRRARATGPDWARSAAIGTTGTTPRTTSSATEARPSSTSSRRTRGSERPAAARGPKSTRGHQSRSVRLGTAPTSSERTSLPVATLPTRRPDGASGTGSMPSMATTAAMTSGSGVGEPGILRAGSRWWTSGHPTRGSAARAAASGHKPSSRASHRASHRETGSSSSAWRLRPAATARRLPSHALSSAEANSAATTTMRIATSTRARQAAAGCSPLWTSSRRTRASRARAAPGAQT